MGLEHTQETAELLQEPAILVLYMVLLKRHLPQEALL